MSSRSCHRSGGDRRDAEYTAARGITDLFFVSFCPSHRYTILEDYRQRQAKLMASDGAGFDQFGVSVSVDGDGALVGASGDDDASGSAYLFERNMLSRCMEARR